MTALTSCRFTVGEDPAVAFSPLGFATPLSVETRSWPCPSGVFACKPVLIGSELQHFPAPAVLLFPIHAGLLAAAWPLDTRAPGNTTNPCSWDQVPPLSRAT